MTPSIPESHRRHVDCEWPLGHHAFPLTRPETDIQNTKRGTTGKQATHSTQRVLSFCVAPEHSPNPCSQGHRISLSPEVAVTGWYLVHFDPFDMPNSPEAAGALD
ncbi:hypothetical protein cyc_02018 [Cyclospora cayetanensis]|uniref:Uncharacterized protein n=1 Tax=Cyclospora cayetanensis TaxID=88456 RepID=A0A1D3CWA4_9EIME|nr:hypothetical protein cyc_02018 [Cyclospora cayetanensis]